MSNEYVDIETIPKPPKPPSRWDERFDAIPQGKALVLRDYAPSTVRTALARYKKKGKGQNMYMTTRKGRDGKYTCYVAKLRARTRTQDNDENRNRETT